MAREFVSRWAMVEELADEIARATDGIDDSSSRDVAVRLVEAGWRPGGED